jgi:hypothetical protein
LVNSQCALGIKPARWREDDASLASPRRSPHRFFAYQNGISDLLQHAMMPPAPLNIACRLP